MESVSLPFRALSRNKRTPFSLLLHQIFRFALPNYFYYEQNENKHFFRYERKKHSLLL